MNTIPHLALDPRYIYRGVRSHIRDWQKANHRRILSELPTKYALPSIALDRLAPDLAAPFDPILDDICMPPFYHRSHDDFGALMRIVAARSPGMLLELGTAHGNTIANICKISSSCQVVTVNAPLEIQTGISTTFELTRDDIGRVYRNHGYGQRVTQLFENTMIFDVRDHLRKKQIDIAIVDACHDYEFVINDFLKCKQVLKKSGIILLHDTHPSMAEHLKGSYLACAALRRRGYDIRHIADTWWGVYCPSGF